MDFTILGRTGLRVSVVCLGAGGHSRLGQRQGASSAHSADLVRAAIDLGVTFIDTAPQYETEAIVGRGIAGRREQVVISTKVTIPRDGTSAGAKDLIDGKELARSVEASLKKLRTDRIDILHLHGVTAAQYDHCRAELVPAMWRLREAGKIRFLGVTERFGTDTAHAMMDRAMTDPVWDVAMIGYNLLNPSAARRALPGARRQGTGVMCMFAVRGALATREKARELIATMTARGDLAHRAVDSADPLGFLIDSGAAATLPEAAYRFCRHAAGIDVVMTGTGSLDHLRANIAAIHGRPLPARTLGKLRRVFGKIDTVSGNPPGARG